jgi:hypothetical protein
LRIAVANLNSPGKGAWSANQTTAGGGEGSIMDDSQANNDNRERPKKRVQELAQRKREEYDELMRLLNERVEEMNANSSDLPKLVIRGSRVELGHITLHLEFDQHPTDPTEYVLALKIGVEDNKRPLFGTGPTPVRHKLRAGASDDSSRILWEGYLGISNSTLDRLTSAALVEFALDLLSSYYRKHKPN